MQGDPRARRRRHDHPRRRRAAPALQAAAAVQGLWSGGDEAKIWRGTDQLDVDLRLGRTIVSVDADAHTATDDQGGTYRYERLLLRHRRPAAPAPRRRDDDVVYFRTLDDYRHLRTLAGDGARFVVIGGGFIGSEIAAALATNGCDVTMVFPGRGICARLFPAELSDFVTGYYREKGVEVLAGETVTGVEGGTVVMSGGAELHVDGVVAGLGIEPDTELAASMGLPVDDGIVVDELGRAGGRDDVFAAGDVARFPLTALGHAARVEHEDHANTPRHGRRSEHGRRRDSRTTTCRSSTPTCSISATRRSATSTRASARSPRGRSRTATALSPTWTTRTGRVGSCSGTSGARSTPRRALIRAGEPVDEAAVGDLA